MSTTYLISGGNRGIGKGLVSTLLSRPNTTVITLVRDPNHGTSQSLSSLPKADGSKLIVEKYDAAASDSAFAAVQRLQAGHGIETIDVVIANTGILSQYGPIATVSAGDLSSHFQVNTVAPIMLFQATLPLLKNSTAAHGPKFFTISTNAASITLTEKMPFDTVAYGLSKAAVNYVMHKLHFEEERIVVGLLQPGWVKTEMGQFAADSSRVASEPPLKIEESVEGLLKQVDGATKEGTSGKFLGYDGVELPW
jgi:norsolorinic acid ketoreductase